MNMSEKNSWDLKILKIRFTLSWTFDWIRMEKEKIYSVV